MKIEYRPIGIIRSPFRQVEGMPIQLDIKPYVPEFDQFPVERIGWLEQTRSRVRGARSDRRFAG